MLPHPRNTVSISPNMTVTIHPDCPPRECGLPYDPEFAQGLLYVRGKMHQFGEPVHLATEDTPIVKGHSITRHNCSVCRGSSHQWLIRWAVWAEPGPIHIGLDLYRQNQGGHPIITARVADYSARLLTIQRLDDL